MYAQVLAARDEHRAAWRTRGVDFPLMVIISVPRLRIIELWRADLGDVSIWTKIVNLCWSRPVSINEVVVAVRAAYPSINRDELYGRVEAELFKRSNRARMSQGNIEERV